MGKLSKYEKETIVNFNEGETEATVYTHNVDLKRSLAEFGGKYPTHCRLKCENEAGGVTYVLEKSRLSIRLVPPYSEECRAAGMGICKEAWFPDCTAGTENSIISAYFTVRMMGADLLF